MTLFIVSFLNHFVDETTTFSMETAYNELREKKAIPTLEEHDEIDKKFVDHRQSIQFDTTKLLSTVKLTPSEKESIDNELREFIPNGIVSRTIKLTKEEMNAIKLSAKQHDYSIQALLLSAFTFACKELFESNKEQAEIVSYQIPYDIRRYLNVPKECIGLFSDGIYPNYSLDILDKPIEVLTHEITKYVRTVTSLDSELFKRFRLTVHLAQFDLTQIPYSLSCSNIGDFICFNQLNDKMKQRFVDFHFSGSTRIPIQQTSKGVMIHMYQLFDGSCNISMSFSYSVVPSVHINKTLELIKKALLSL